MADVALVIDHAPVQEALAWPDKATALTIRTPDDYRGAAGLLRGIKDLRAKIQGTFKPHIERAFAAHRALVAEQRQAEAPLVDAEATIKRKLSAYDVEQERVRRQEETRLRELARQEEERRRLEEAAALEREAQATGNVALQAEAEALIEAPIEAPAVLVQTVTPKVEGLSYQERWSAEVTNLPALIAYVASRPEFSHLLEPNMPALNGLARNLKGTLSLPGVVAKAERTVASRR